MSSIQDPARLPPSAFRTGSARKASFRRGPRLCVGLMELKSLSCQGKEPAIGISPAAPHCPSRGSGTGEQAVYRRCPVPGGFGPCRGPVRRWCQVQHPTSSHQGPQLKDEALKTRKEKMSDGCLGVRHGLAVFFLSLPSVSDLVFLRQRCLENCSPTLRLQQSSVHSVQLERKRIAGCGMRNSDVPA